MSENGKAMAVRDPGAVLESVIVKGDLKLLTPVEKASYYKQVCESIGVNPLTQPFAYIQLQGGEKLYATRNCTDQLRASRRLNAQIVSRERIDDVYVVTARVTAPDGRSDESIGAVTIGNLKGDSLANALMKCETKAKRRATLSLVGLSFLDETEVETIPGARVEPAAAPALPSARAQAPAAPQTLGQTVRVIEQAFPPSEPTDESPTEDDEDITVDYEVNGKVFQVPGLVSELSPSEVLAFVGHRQNLEMAVTVDGLAEAFERIREARKAKNLADAAWHELVKVKDAKKAELSQDEPF